MIRPKKKRQKVIYSRPEVQDVVLWDEYTAKIEAVAFVDIRARAAT